MKRRAFIKTTAKGAALVAASTSASALLSSFTDNHAAKGKIKAFIPLPIQVVMDDVGWWSGKDGSAYNEPFRTGINRNHVIADYKAIVELGKSLGIRPQAATVLCEWDKNNILRDVPHSNWMGKKWDNSKWVGPWLEEAADVFNNNKEHIELSMHGLAHEWWEGRIMSRAEWANSETGVMRQEEVVDRHIDAFVGIMHQNGLYEAPKSFIPTNFSHTFGVSKGRAKSMAQMLKKHGFTYINTPYSYGFHNVESVQNDLFGIDSGVLTVNRGEDILDWNIISTMPEGKISGSTCGMHWPNLLHIDPKRNSEIVQGWIKILKSYQEKPDYMLAKNSVYFQKQLVHHAASEIEVAGDKIHINFSKTNKLGTILVNDELTVKIESKKKLNFSSDDIRFSTASLRKDAGTYSYILSLKKDNQDKASISFKEV
jgi:hypothetical protein